MALAPTPAALLELTAVGKQLGGRPVLRGIDLEIGANETVGILGPNGSGKTTLLRVAGTLSAPTNGRVRVAGHDTAREPHRARERIGFAPQQPSLHGEATVAEHLRLWHAIRGMPAPSPGGAGALGADGFGLEALADKAAGTLSRGQRQRLALAIALAGDPDLLLLDEPFAGLDADGAARLEAVLRQRRGRKATLMALHDEAQAARLCDRVLILADGRLAPAAQAAPSAHRTGPLSGPASPRRVEARVA